MRHDVEEAHVDAIDHLRQIARERTSGDASPLVRSQLEESLGTWLEEHAVPKAWDLAGTFADAGVTVEDLEGFAGTVPKTLQADALGWVACGLSVERIVGEIASSGQFQTARVFAAIVVLSILAMALFTAVVAVEKWSLRKYPPTANRVIRLGES